MKKEYKSPEFERISLASYEDILVASPDPDDEFQNSTSTVIKPGGTGGLW